MHPGKSERSVEHFPLALIGTTFEAPSEDSHCGDQPRTAELYRHIVRIRAATSMRICFALRSETLGLATGQFALSKN